MKQTQEFEGKNLEQAIDNACKSLNLTRKKLSYDVISSGSTGIFGIVGVKKAKIRVSLPDKREKKGTGNGIGWDSFEGDDLNGVMSIVDEAFAETPATPDTTPDKAPGQKQSSPTGKKSGHKPEQKSDQKPQKEQARKPASAKEPAPAKEKGKITSQPMATDATKPPQSGGEKAVPPEPEKTPESAKPQQPRTAPASGTAPESKPEQKSEQKPEKKHQEQTAALQDSDELAADNAEFNENIDEEIDNRDEGYPPKYKDEIPVDVSEESIALGVETLQRMVDLITSDSIVVASTDQDRLLLRIEGGNSGVLIGRRGQTLEAMQFLTDKIINRKSESRVRLKVDIEGYMETRKANLQSLAHKMADKAKKTGKPSTINQMTAQDRRIVHIALKDDTRVRTQSMGDGYYRRLVIFPKKGSFKKQRPPRKQP